MNSLSSFWLFLLLTFSKFVYLNWEMNAFASSEYFFILFSFALNMLVMCPWTICESPCMINWSTFIAKAMRRPAKSASCFDLLLLTLKLYFKAYTNSAPLGFLSTKPAPWWSFPRDPSTYKFHAILGSGLLVTVFRLLSWGVHFLRWNQPELALFSFTGNRCDALLNLSTHFVMRQVKSRLCKVCIKGASVSTVTGYAWMYGRSFRHFAKIEL